MHGVLNISERQADGTSGMPIGAPADVVAELSAMASSPTGVEWIEPSSVGAHHLAEWQSLADQASDANVFAQPWMVRAGLNHCREADGATIAFVRDGTGRLIGVAPLGLSRGYGRVPLSILSGWSHPNSFLTSMVIAEGREAAFWLTLLPALNAAPLSGPMVCLEGIADDSGAWHGLTEACRQLGLPLTVEGTVTRAMLATKMQPDAYWEESVRSKKRKELRRQWARLNEQGSLNTDQLSAHGPAAISAWTDEFLTLEASGWKGTNGSALASNADTLGFFREAMTSAHRAGQVEMTALRLDGRAIAMLITLFSGKAGFSFKTAFDEDYARFSPGVLLQRESLAILSQRSLDWIDSCAAQDHPMIDSLWRERRTVLTVSLPLPGTSNRILYSLAGAAKRAWHLIKDWRRPAHAPSPRPDTRSGEPCDGPTQEDQP